MTKVLLVEDDNNLREIYEARLAAEGYDISAAQDGEEALEVAKKVQPDLIISDVMMPRISGFEMLDILRNTQGLKHTKVIMLTALGQEEDKTRADSLGADRYLVKSQVTLEDIVKAAHELLNGADSADDEASTDATPQLQQSDLSPTAPPAVAAAAHSTAGAPSATPEQPLSSFEDTTTQPTPTPAPATIAAPSSAGEPIVGGPAPITTATVANDPLASNDQTLQAAAQALSAQPAVPPAASPVTRAIIPTPAFTQPSPVQTSATPPTVPAVTPAVIDQTPMAEPMSAPAEQAAPRLESQPANQMVITPPEAQTQQLPSLPEIERAMQETAASVPAQGLVNGAPGIVTPAAPTEPEPTEPTTAPDMSAPAPAEQQPTDFTRPSIGGTTPVAPDVALPEAQTTAQESATVSDQINNFAPPQFPDNVGEIVEAPGSPDAIASSEPAVAEASAPAPAEEQPAPAPEMSTSVQSVTVEQAPPDPMAAASAPSPSSLPATGGQRTIQPLTSNTPQLDINQLAAQEGSVTPPAGTPDLVHQPGGVFTPDQSGSAADAAL